MRDRHFMLSTCTIASAPMWITAFILVVISISTDRLGFGQLGILFGAVGAVLNVRSFIGSMAWRERGAFEAGREFERSQTADAKVLNLR